MHAFIGLALICVLPPAWQVMATRWARRRYPAPGRFVPVHGTRLHIRCSGEGPVTVVFESGSGMSSNAWTRVQPEVAKIARACSYDRPGLGWSEAMPGADSVDVL